MKKIGIIWKSCSLYALFIMIVEVLRSDKKWKIRLYSDTTNFNKVMIKNAKPLFNFHMIFDKLKEAIVYTIMNMIVGY